MLDVYCLKTIHTNQPLLPNRQYHIAWLSCLHICFETNCQSLLKERQYTNLAVEGAHSIFVIPWASNSGSKDCSPIQCDPCVFNWIRINFRWRVKLFWMSNFNCRWLTQYRILCQLRNSSIHMRWYHIPLWLSIAIEWTVDFGKLSADASWWIAVRLWKVISFISTIISYWVYL